MQATWSKITDFNFSVGVYLCQVEDVCVVDYLQGVDSSFEGVDLLMRISHQDFPTMLRQHHIHDGWDRAEEEDVVINLTSFIKINALAVSE